MDRPGMRVWTWTLCVLLSCVCAAQATAPQYMVAVPAVLEAGTATKVCASLMKPNETLEMIITLMCDEKNTTLLKTSSSEEFYYCVDLKVPPKPKVHTLKVEVRGATFSSTELRKVLTRVYEPMTFVQTDKPIYLPGQTVHFRVVTMDSRMRPFKRMYNVIEVEDANDNRVAQWLNQTADGSILQLSYSLNSEAQEGLYQVIVTVGKNKIHQSFTVEKYVLPKFDVNVMAPEEVSIGDEEIEVEICAKYTYGQPVPGVFRVKMCRPLSRYHLPSLEELSLGLTEAMHPCFHQMHKSDAKGCAPFTFKMSTFTQRSEKMLRDYLDLMVEMEEHGTGVSRKLSKRLQISYVIGKLTFIDPPKLYDRGSNLEGEVKAVHFNDTPIAGMQVYLLEGERWSTRLLQNLTTGSDGVAAFSLPAGEREGTINLHVSDKTTQDYPGYKTPYYKTGHHSVSMTQPPSADIQPVSSLEVVKKNIPLPCDRQAKISIKYTVVGEKTCSIMVIYLVLSRGAIIMHGTKHVKVEDIPVNEGEIEFELDVSPELSPEVQVLAYTVLPSETVIAGSEDFSVEKCFSNKVSVEFLPPSAVPGEETTLHVKAQPDSLCGVSAVDQSVLIKSPGNTLTADKIFDLLPVTKVSGFPYEVHDDVECLRVRPRRYIRPPPDGRPDAYTVFESVGLKMATNLFIQMPKCLTFRERSYYHDRHRILYDHPVVMMNRVSVMSERMGAGAEPELDSAPIETVRTFFPETWIWDLVEVGGSGEENVSLTVPDTITTWETEAFCLSPQGFGLAPRKEITVFQPFFLELTLPYSVIRGEHFELKATVFNYLPTCIMIFVEPEQSLDYTLTPLSGDRYRSCLCGNERKTLSWNLSPTALGVLNVKVSAMAVTAHTSCNNEIVSVPERGRVDMVTRTLIVKAEGTEMTTTHNMLLCPKGENLTEEVELQLPENVVPGSTRGSMSVLGDILGRALKNLDGLLRMPYGCGEQNMALLAPNIYILQYLRDTQQLTPAIMEKSAKFLSSGSQRQLNYKHNDGAFSTFGYGTGNTWLTAFVMRSFAKAQSFVYIDPRNIESSKSWLEQHQHKNGCFQQLGKLFNNRMKGGVSDEVTLTAYITAAFLEMNVSTNDNVVNSSLSCLRAAANGRSNTYTTALLAYVFTLAGDMENRAQLLEHLDTIGHKKGGFLHWSQTAAETSASLSVEISSYVMLAYLSAAPTPEDLGYVSGIVRWLTGQQNCYGGFSSTQDTVVALQALALYSTLVFSPGGSSTVTALYPSGQLTFDVNKDNKLLYQEKALQDLTGKYIVQVGGTACASIQISLHYNIPVSTHVKSVSVEVQPESNCTTRKLGLLLKALYFGEEEVTNMVIMDIKMLSGFIPDPESLKNLKDSMLVDRVEQKEDHILVYIRELVKDQRMAYRLNLIQLLAVENMKPAQVKIYDYYQPEDQAETEYIYTCDTA